MTTLNISNQNIAGDCNLKCEYFYDYQNSSTTATNEGFRINLTYDKTNVQPVIYNTNKYEVSSVLLVAPSMHFFNDSQTNAEVIIEHMPIISGPVLCVAFPIIAYAESSAASSLLTQIINAVAANAPAQGESTNINISNFNLNSFIVPKTPFYSYTQDSVSWIVFGKEKALTLSQSTLDTLGKIIKPTLPGQIPPGPEVFYNSSGAIKGFNNSDQIYIDCQPVSSSEEEVDVVTSKPPISFDLLNNSTAVFIIQIIAIIILFLGLLFGIYYGLKYVTNSNITLPKFGKKS